MVTWSDVAEAAPELAAHHRLCAATTASVGRPDEVLFALSIDSAMTATYEARGVFPPVYARWSAPVAGS
jgi:hypothetical protein